MVLRLISFCLFYFCMCVYIKYVIVYVCVFKYIHSSIVFVSKYCFSVNTILNCSYICSHFFLFVCVTQRKFILSLIYIYFFLISMLPHYKNTFIKFSFQHYFSFSDPLLSLTVEY